MAVRLLDSTAVIRRLTNIIASNAGACHCFWYRSSFISTSPNYIAPFAVTDLAYNGWAGIFSNASVSDGSYHLNTSNGVPVASPNFIVPANRNVHFGYRRSNTGTNHFFYIAGILIGTFSDDLSAVVFAEMLLGNDRFSVVDAPVDIWDYAEWADEKSVSTLKAQAASYGVPANLVNLRAFTPLTTDLLDISGNNNHWLGSGNFTFVSNPSLPANVTSSSAIVISSLPYNFSLADSSGLSLWFKLAASVNEILPFGYGVASGYKPLLHVYQEGDLNFEWPTNIAPIGVPNKAAQFPAIIGNNYYLNYVPDLTGMSSPAPFTLNVQAGPTETAPAGSILINDDSIGFSLAVLSRVDGHVLRFENPTFPSGFSNPRFPAGEAGANLWRDNGRIVFIDDFASGINPQIYLYDSNLNFIGLFAPPTHNVKDVISTNGLPPFYLGFNPGSPNRAYFLKMLDDGTILPTVIGPLSNASPGAYFAAGISNDGSIIYLCTGTSASTAKIIRWDVINNLPLSDLVPGPFTFSSVDIIVCQDGHVIFKIRTGANHFLRKYNKDTGAVIWTLDLTARPSGNTIDRMIQDPTDYPNSMWIFYHEPNGFSNFIKVNTNTGLITYETGPVPEFEGGIYQPAETANPIRRSGHSFSCPMLMTSAIVNPSIPPNLFSGIYKIVPDKRQDTLWLENFTGTRDVKIP